MSTSAWRGLDSRPSTPKGSSEGPQSTTSSSEGRGGSSTSSEDGNIARAASPPSPRSPTKLESTPFLPLSGDSEPPTRDPSFDSSAPASTLAAHSNSATPRPSRSGSSGNTQFVSSPLNPTPLSPTTPTSAIPFIGSGNGGPISPFSKSRPGSRGSVMGGDMSTGDRYSSHGSRSALLPPSNAGGQRGSMVLYRLATEDEHGMLLPPRRHTFMAGNRDSVASSSGDSIMTLGDESKYPSGHVKYASGMSTLSNNGQRGMVPYVYDPTLDDKEEYDDEDMLHDPDDKTEHKRKMAFPIRGILNIGALVLLLAALLCLFVAYPVMDFYRNNARNLAMIGNTRVNSSGQVEDSPDPFTMPTVIDVMTPEDVKKRVGWDGENYNLVFSDEFETPGRTFYPGDDPFWEAPDIWYWATQDLEWYDPSQVTTKDGKLVITMDRIPDNVVGGQPGYIPGVVDPLTGLGIGGQPVVNHGYQYKSGMLQSWNKFCFTSGYIEVSLSLPGPDENTIGYWPGVWTMGNLGRPGYGATTDGVWPYSYDSCDVGTFPNQTERDGSGPAAALRSEMSRSKYDFKLSVLPGQRLSSCTCPNEDHPGPRHDKGRGSPEIDLLEAEIDKLDDLGQVTSQSAQVAPFNHDYLFNNATEDVYKVYNTELTRPNSYRGSPVQQSVSSLTKLPSDMFQGSGAVQHTVGIEYHSNPARPEEGFINWQVDGKQSHSVGANALIPDQGPDGSGVGRRLISEEPMSIILNLGMSNNWQKPLVDTMTFPGLMTIDYVRVYQREGEENISCSPPDYPTEDYIKAHADSYGNPNITNWNYAKPRNSLWEGGC